jgi:hypothetical protein
MRRALIIGIDEYPTAPLRGCVNDAQRVAEILSKHEDGSPNFDCQLFTSPPLEITRAFIRQKVAALLEHEADVALFYFSGHGTVNNLGGYIVSQDAQQYDEGVAMTDVLAIANGASKVREAVIWLDCCHSGSLGQVPTIKNEAAVLREGVSVLTASRSGQVAMEVHGGGVFTGLLVGALSGGAADVLGKVTIGSVYAYIEQALNAWDQRPLFKCHVSKLVSLRNCRPEVEPELLRLLPKYFGSQDEDLPLDPSYEPDADPKHEEHEKIFGHLQRFRAARLVIPVGEDHMYFAAMNRRSCKLTPLGQFYWRLANEGRI